MLDENPCKRDQLGMTFIRKREIERKFLVADDWQPSDPNSFVRIRQGYLSLAPERTVRVRTVTHTVPQSSGGKLTVKGIAKGITRPEFEYDIPWEDADDLLGMSIGRIIEKDRYSEDQWSVDVFRQFDFILAEIELGHKDAALPSSPAWLRAEVTNDIEYYNSTLAVRD